MAEPYFDPQETPAARLGQRVYHDALSDRRGFRDDQVGIPAEDEVWSEIFEEIGQAVFAAGYVPASEVQRAREEALLLREALADHATKFDVLGAHIEAGDGKSLSHEKIFEWAKQARDLATPPAENGEG